MYNEIIVESVEQNDNITEQSQSTVQTVEESPTVENSTDTDKTTVENSSPIPEDNTQNISTGSISTETDTVQEATPETTPEITPEVSPEIIPDTDHNIDDVYTLLEHIDKTQTTALQVGKVQNAFLLFLVFILFFIGGMILARTVFRKL